MKKNTSKFMAIWFIVFLSSVGAFAAEVLVCAGGNIEVTYKEGFWPITSDKATFKDQVRKLNLAADSSMSSDGYGIENDNWVTDGDIVFQLRGTKAGQPSYDPYLLLVNSDDINRADVGDKVRIGFSSTIPEKIRDYTCIVKK